MVFSYMKLQLIQLFVLIAKKHHVLIKHLKKVLEYSLVKAWTTKLGDKVLGIAPVENSLIPLEPYIPKHNGNLG